MLFIILVVVIFATFSFIIRRYRRCPSDKILVVYGKTGGGSAKCIHGGGKFVWPIIQDYAYLNLTPISIDANLTNALSRQNIRVDVPCRFTVGISTEPDSMNNAAERLLGLTSNEIQELARDILFGQLRLVIATMSIEEINSDRDKFLENISKNVEVELKKIGLRLINVNVTDIKDESGYIEALGKEAAAKAINEAKVSVAEQDKYGEIGKAEAVRDTRIKTSEANAIAVKGENNAQIDIANSNAYRREKEAEANRLAIAAEKVQQAKALQEAYAAEKEAELARAERERSTQQANIIVPEEIEKQRRIIEAEAEAENEDLSPEGRKKEKKSFWGRVKAGLSKTKLPRPAQTARTVRPLSAGYSVSCPLLPAPAGCAGAFLRGSASGCAYPDRRCKPPYVPAGDNSFGKCNRNPGYGRFRTALFRSG